MTGGQDRTGFTGNVLGLGECAALLFLNQRLFPVGPDDPVVLSYS